MCGCVKGRKGGVNLDVMRLNKKEGKEEKEKKVSNLKYL